MLKNRNKMGLKELARNMSVEFDRFSHYYSQEKLREFESALRDLMDKVQRCLKKRGKR